MTVDMDGLEQALDALLTAMADDQAKWPQAPLDAVPVKFANLSDPIPTRSDIEVAQLLRHPVYFACRLAVRRLGEQAFTITGSTDGMRGVAERVADRTPAQYGRRLSMMDSAWDGVGGGSDRWWA